ncbi:IS256 family transposase, partial [Marinilabiliaceae bacterium JC040]|nr:IS256 family transposase [Marinilabiliaceae bacterium JC040]
MDTKELLTDDFLKQFKTGEDLNNFLKEILKRGMEKILEGELYSHLGYDKHEQYSSSNIRNGYIQKQIKTSHGDTTIQVPRDRDSSFNLMLIPKRRNMIDGLENVIVSLYAKGMSTIIIYRSRW